MVPRGNDTGYRQKWMHRVMVRFCHSKPKSRHRVIDLATLLDGTKSPWRFNAGG
jgi:hypothetical protein